MNRLSRVIGHLEYVKRMISQDEDCADVLAQIAAARSALNGLGKQIINEHITHCITHAVEDVYKRQVGESGCGKSTLLKAAMGLLGSSGVVTRGDIWYQGKNLPDLSEKELRKLNGPELGMIFQSAGSSFCPIRTVGTQMYEMMAEHGSVTKKEFLRRAIELLGKLGFEDERRILDSYPFEPVSYTHLSPILIMLVVS